MHSIIAQVIGMDNISYMIRDTTRYWPKIIHSSYPLVDIVLSLQLCCSVWCAKTRMMVEKFDVCKNGYTHQIFLPSPIILVFAHQTLWQSFHTDLSMNDHSIYHACRQ